MKPATMGWTIALVVVAVFGFVAMFAIEGEISTRDLRVAETERNESRSALSKTTEAVDRMNERVAQAKMWSEAKAKAAKEIEVLENSVHRKNQEIAEKTAAWQKVRDSFQRDLELVRKAAVGSQLKEVKIGGIVYETVKVSAVSAETVSIETEAGVHKVAPEKISADLAGKLKLGWNPVLKTTPTLLKEETTVAETEAPVAKENSPPPPQEPPAPSAPKGPPKENPVTAELSKTRTELTTLGNNIRLAETTLASRRQACAVLENDYQAAKARGKIVSVSPELAQARKVVQTLTNQLTTARQQYATLSNKVNDLTVKESEWEQKNAQTTP